MNLQKACSAIVVIGPPDAFNLFLQLRGRVYRYGQKDTPLIITLTTANTYDDFLRQDAENKAHPIVVSQLGARIQPKDRDLLVKEMEPYHVTFFSDSLPESVMADRFYMATVGQAFPSRFFVSYLNPILNRKLVGKKGYIPKRRWKAVVRWLAFDPSSKLLGILSADYQETSVKTVDSYNRSFHSRELGQGLTGMDKGAGDGRATTPGTGMSFYRRL
jgi:hypothetical protein